MPITGVHAMLYTPEAEKLREVLKEILPVRVGLYQPLHAQP